MAYTVSENMARFLKTLHTHTRCKTSHVSCKSKHFIQNYFNFSKNTLFAYHY